MNSQEVLEIVFSKDTSDALTKFRELELLSDDSNEYYQYFNMYLESINNEKSCVRARGFKMIMHSARWDSNNLIDENFDEIMKTLKDEKATVVRQCLPMLEYIGIYKKELIPKVRKKLDDLDYLKYKESMQGLIKKDIDNVRATL